MRRWQIVRLSVSVDNSCVNRACWFHVFKLAANCGSILLNFVEWNEFQTRNRNEQLAQRNSETRLRSKNLQPRSRGVEHKFSGTMASMQFARTKHIKTEKTVELRTFPSHSKTVNSFSANVILWCWVFLERGCIFLELQIYCTQPYYWLIISFWDWPHWPRSKEGFIVT